MEPYDTPIPDEDLVRGKQTEECRSDFAPTTPAPPTTQPPTEPTTEPTTEPVTEAPPAPPRTY